MGGVVTRVDPGRGAAGRTHEATDPARFAPPIDGLVFRGFRGIDADLPGMFEANRLGRMADGELEPIEYGGMRASYEHLERSDPATDILVLELHGEICGYARVDWADTNEGDRTYNSIVSLRPDARRREIRSGALRWAEERRRAIAAAHALAPSDTPEAAGRRPSWLTAFANDGDMEAGLLLEAAGYRRHRRFFSMLRPNLDEIPDLPLPDGLEVRPITSHPAQMRRIFDADTEAFRDHYGWVDESDDAFASFVDDPSTDPSLWVVAFDGEEVAGGVLNGIHRGHDGLTEEGWLDSVFTRRPWRRRGLARALIVRSLAVLRERGVRTAALGVDSENPNHALSLYESCGFEMVSSASIWRRPLEPDQALPSGAVL